MRAELQWLADEAAWAEGAPLRTVPALADHALADQLTVLVLDLLAAAPQRREQVVARLAALRRALP